MRPNGDLAFIQNYERETDARTLLRQLDDLWQENRRRRSRGEKQWPITTVLDFHRRPNG